MIVGCYTVHLYCDREGHVGYHYSSGGYAVKTPEGYKDLQNEFAGENERECLAQARRVGWKITRDRRAICPFCD